MTAIQTTWSRVKTALRPIGWIIICAMTIYLISPVRVSSRSTEEMAEFMYAQTTRLDREMASLEIAAKHLDRASSEKFSETRFTFDVVMSGTQALIFRGKTAETLGRERVQKVHDDSIKQLEELLAEAKALIR